LSGSADTLVRDWLPPPGRAAPDLIALQASRPDRYPGLLFGSGDSGWDILFAFPQDVARFDPAQDFAALEAHPAMRLQPPMQPPPDALPFRGGWLCALSYELGAWFEPSAGRAGDGDDFPAAWLVRIPAAILFDRVRRRCILVAEAGAGDLLERMARDLDATPPAVPPLPLLQALTEDPPERFLDGVARVQAYIRAGDVFQVNLSRGWHAEFAAAVPPAALFARLMQ
jgi:anthranilate synthase component 1